MKKVLRDSPRSRDVWELRLRWFVCVGSQSTFDWSSSWPQMWLCPTRAMDTVKGENSSVTTLSKFKFNLRHTSQPWFVRIICAGLRPRMAGNQLAGCTGWHHMPRCPRAFHMVPSSTLPVTNIPAFQRTRTRPVDHPATQSPIRSQPTSPQRPSFY